MCARADEGVSRSSSIELVRLATFRAFARSGVNLMGRAHKAVFSSRYKSRTADQVIMLV